MIYDLFPTFSYKSSFSGSLKFQKKETTQDDLTITRQSPTIQQLRTSFAWSANLVSRVLSYSAPVARTRFLDACDMYDASDLWDSWISYWYIDAVTFLPSTYSLEVR